MLVCKTKRYKNSFISYNRNARFRDDLIVFGKRQGHAIFLTTFNNIYITYEAITKPVANGTYKIKVISIDDFNNQTIGQEGTVTIAFYPLPPKDVTGSVSGNNVTLAWDHSINGAPDNYVVYGNGGDGDIDRTVPLKTVSGSVLTTTFAVADGQWKFVVESIKDGIESKSMILLFLAVPITATIPPSPGPSVIDGSQIINNIVISSIGLILENVSVGKVRIRFYWPHGSLASSFNIYYDNATGTVNYTAPAFSFSRQSSLIQDYTTTQLHATDDEKTYIFVVRSVSANGVEDGNTEEFLITVDGLAPEEVDNLTLDTVF